ncbi:D-aminoacyl-tRNA deacylase [Acetivibrio sp. MSJd-27]|uniref:D-aminoacyl-tRNA deacylase n=1 Tax=Acetivibrio sp. MSJd-27 TaxID=2841523 RepID=UPI0015ABF438|nr:D-aminoacyl-tRNA deacylase [Acetivibrio sp. MSJd-27]MBU5449205.1 D-tyrosyl-tRNA(Tyr) deacylase [Acetivibrio sp. MSJd-27]
MKIVLQRVSRASVTVEERVKGRIGEGYMALVGITDTDTEEILKYMAEKMINLRIFEDEAGKMNRSLLDVGGEILLISQFTLYADCKKGRRPSFIKAGSPAFAEQMYENMIKYLEHLLPGKIQTGQFGADMKVELVNDGPVTIVLDSDEIM